MSNIDIRFKTGLMAWAMAVTVARAARYPNDFAEAHWLLDYRFGLIRRGLAGSIFTLLTSARILTPSAGTVAGVAFVVFAAFCVTLLAVAWRILQRAGGSDAAFLGLAVFVTSPFVVMSAHFMGYLDHLVVLCTIGGVWLAWHGRPWSAGSVALLGVLVHESFVVIGLPLVAVTLLIRPGRPTRIAARFRDLAPLAIPAAAYLALLVSEIWLLDRGRLRQDMVTRLSAFPFIERDMNIFLPEWLTTSTVDNLRTMGHAFFSHLSYPGLLRLMVPPAAVIVVVALSIVPRGKRLHMLSLSLAVAALPLLMHAVAWDTARIWTFIIFGAFASQWVIAEAMPESSNALPLWLGVGAAGILVLNLFSHTPLMDAQTERFSSGQRLLLYSPLLAATAWLVVARVGRVWRPASSASLAQRTPTAPRRPE